MTDPSTPSTPSYHRRQISKSLECWNAASGVVCESAYCSGAHMGDRSRWWSGGLAASGGKLTFYNK